MILHLSNAPGLIPEGMELGRRITNVVDTTTTRADETTIDIKLPSGLRPR